MKFLKIHAEGHAPSFEVNGRLVTEREYELAVAWFAQARAEMREEAIAAAEAEDELPGPMPPEMLLVPLEDALRGAVRVTKRNIIAAIRALEV